jgi:hypothetical protein
MSVALDDEFPLKHLEGQPISDARDLVYKRCPDKAAPTYLPAASTDPEPWGRLSAHAFASGWMRVFEESCQRTFTAH